MKGYVFGWLCQINHMRIFSSQKRYWQEVILCKQQVKCFRNHPLAWHISGRSPGIQTGRRPYCPEGAPALGVGHFSPLLHLYEFTVFIYLSQRLYYSYEVTNCYIVRRVASPCLYRRGNKLLPRPGLSFQSNGHYCCCSYDDIYLFLVTFILLYEVTNCYRY